MQFCSLALKTVGQFSQSDAQYHMHELWRLFLTSAISFYALVSKTIFNKLMVTSVERGSSCGQRYSRKFDRGRTLLIHAELHWSTYLTESSTDST